MGEEGTELKGIGMLLWCRGGGGETDVPFKVLLPVCNIINVNNRNNIKTLGKKIKIIEQTFKRFNCCWLHFFLFQNNNNIIWKRGNVYTTVYIYIVQGVQL